MWPFTKSSSDAVSQTEEHFPESGKQPDAPETPPVGNTSPATLAALAAEGKRGAAWRLFHWIAQGNREAIEAVRTFPDGRLLTYFLEWLALGTWAGKQFNVPKEMRQPHFRTQVRTLFLSGPDTAEELSRQVLCSGLKHRQPKVRAEAAHLLGLLDDSAAGPDLISALSDAQSEVRVQAARALGRVCPGNAAPALVAALNIHDEALASQVRQALHHIGSKAVPALLTAVHSPDAWVRWHALRALGDLHDARCMPTLVEALADGDYSVAWMSARDLAPMGPQVVAPVLRLLINAPGTPLLMETAGYVLRRQRRPEQLLEILEPLLQSMRGVEYRVTTPIEAERALEQLAGNVSSQ